jgi:hypothetical protein
MSQVLIMFPAIHKGIIPTKEATTEPYNYVSVISGHAVVITPYSNIFIDLNDYFINYITIVEDHRQGFKELMDWMEGKHFTSEFWSYLTGWNTVEVVDENSISISGDKFEKELHYTHDENINIKNVLNMMVNNFKSGKYQLASIGISNFTLKIIDKTIGKIIQKNPLIFEFISLNSTIRFTVDSMPCVFGIVLSNNALTTKQFIFDGFKNFALKAELKL